MPKVEFYLNHYDNNNLYVSIDDVNYPFFNEKLGDVEDFIEHLRNLVEQNRIHGT